MKARDGQKHWPKQKRNPGIKVNGSKTSGVRRFAASSGNAHFTRAEISGFVRLRAETKVTVRVFEANDRAVAARLKNSVRKRQDFNLAATMPLKNGGPSHNFSKNEQIASRAGILRSATFRFSVNKVGTKIAQGGQTCSLREPQDGYRQSRLVGHL